MDTIFILDDQELTNDTKIKYDTRNPKRPGTKIYGEYEKFKKVKTVGELRQLREKHWRADLKFDFEHGYLQVNGKYRDQIIGRKAQAALNQPAKPEAK